MPFRPAPNSQLTIRRRVFTVCEHPAAPGMAYGQSGRRALVYQLCEESGRYFALKVFNQTFRTVEIEQSAKNLQSYASLPGLEVCQRVVLTDPQDTTLLQQYPDLRYAVLMPWVPGRTWQEVILEQIAFKPRESFQFANSLVNILAGMERAGLAHCDLSGANVLLPGLFNHQPPVALVDVEEMYLPGAQTPSKLPAGTPGYNHKVAAKGLWSADSDRFAGAVMLAEILTRHDDRIRQVSFQEQYFDPQEMQQNTDRYRLAARVLKEQGDTLAADLFSRAWFSQTLSECPTFSEWFVALNRPVQTPVGIQTQIQQPTSGMSEPVSSWRKLVDTPTEQIANPQMVAVSVGQIRLMLQKAAADGYWADTLNLAAQLLQILPADTESLTLQNKAQRLLQLEQAIQSSWQVAIFSGTVEDWDNCLRTITTTYYQAKNVTRYEQFLQDAEKEREIAVCALMLEQLINEGRWDKARTICANLPLDHPRVAGIMTQIKMEELRLPSISSPKISPPAIIARKKVDSETAKNVRVAHAKQLSKGYATNFLIQIYPPKLTIKATRNIHVEFGKDAPTHIAKTDIDKSVVKIRLVSPVIEFLSTPTVKILADKITSVSIAAIPKNDCKPGNHDVTLEISDENDVQIMSKSFSVHIVDYVFGSVSRPLFSNIVSASVGLGSLLLFILTFMGQVDTTFGLTSGTAAGAMASFLFIRANSLYRQLQQTIP